MPRPLLSLAARRLALALGEVLWLGPEPARWWSGTGPDRATNRLVWWLWRRLPWLAGLYALVVVIAASGGVIDSSGRGNGGVAFLLLLPFVGGLMLAARRPVEGWRLVTLWLVVTPFLIAPPAGLAPPLEPWQWCLWVPALLLVGIDRPGRGTVAVGVVSALVLGALTALTPWPVHAGYLLVSVAGMAVPLVVGASVGARANSQRALAWEQARVAAVQAEQGALAERARIAREMHDVVAHHMSMIAVRCETASYRLPELNEVGQVEIAEIGAAARAAMTDMQGLLGVLRTAESGPEARVELTPQPSLADLIDLVEQTKASGVPVDATLADDVAAVPAQLGLSAYRIVQEALTNARKHAPGAAVTLRLRRSGSALELVVRSAPPVTRPVSAPSSGGGHGLAGMRERAGLHGGELVAGSDNDGGFTVRAVLPLSGEL